MRQGCPSRDQLLAYRAGQLDADSLETLARHVEACPHCLAHLRSTSEEAVAGTVRGVADSSRPQAPSQPYSAGLLDHPATSTEQHPTDGSSTPEDVDTSTSNLNEAGSITEREYLGRYENLGEIRRGGMGVIYRARDPNLRRIVALKMINGSSQLRQLDIDRFLREAEAVAQLKHDNIIKILEFGQLDGQPYFTMELAELGSLADHLERFQQDMRASVTLLARVARAVQHVHDHSIVHRDLKPGNILLEADDKPVVSDFGLAKWVDVDTDLTHPGQAPGTAAYMAPEQFDPEDDVPHPPIDVWALGVILYELLTGQRPFAGPKRHDFERAILTTEPPRPRSLQPRLPYDLETITLKCLDKNPARRYASADDLADDLERWLRGDPIQGRRLPRIVRLGRWCRRHAAVGTVVLALLLAVGSAAAMLLMRDRRDPGLERGPAPAEDPDAGGKALLDRVNRGEKVYLIGDKGPPAWYRWGVTGSPPYSHNGVFTLQANFASLMELLPGPLPGNYRMGGELQVLSNEGKAGGAGFFFGYRSRPAVNGKLHTFVHLVQSNLEANMELRVYLNYYNPHPRESGHLLHGKQVNERVFFPRTSPWNSFSLDVAEDRCEVAWNGVPLASLSEANVKPGEKFMLGKRKDLLPDQDYAFSPQGSLGIVLQKAVCSFRNVWVEKK